jgi:hypothetical protein
MRADQDTSMSLTSHGVRRIGWSLFFCAFLVALATESGELNSWDTANRLQVTRWLWTDAPQVVNPDTSWYGVVGRGGEKFAWTGIGQSLWMLPAQVASSRLAALVSKEPEFAQRLETMLVTYLTFPATTGLVVVVLYALLLATGFRPGVAGLAALGALWCTSLLPYTNINQENALILLCTLSALWSVAKGVSSGLYGWWFFAGTAAGFNMLVRLTSGLDALAVALFGLVLLGTRSDGTLWQSLRRFAPQLLLAVAVASFFVFLERAYNFYRFESWTNTYYDLQKLAVPGYLYEGDYRTGFPGLMWSIKTNVWQFDPLALLGLAAVPVFWRQMPAGVRASASAVLFLFAGYVLFYAGRPFFDGDHGWGSRYTTTPMILLSVLAIALILTFSRRKWPNVLLSVVAALAMLVQVLSTFFWYNLEEFQQKERLGISESMVVLRAQNVAAYYTGNFREWQILPQIPGDRLETPNYFPFLAGRHLPGHRAAYLYLVWALCAALAVGANIVVFLQLRRLHASEGSAPVCAGK